MDILEIVVDPVISIFEDILPSLFALVEGIREVSKDNKYLTMSSILLFLKLGVYLYTAGRMANLLFIKKETEFCSSVKKKLIVTCINIVMLILIITGLRSVIIHRIKTTIKGDVEEELEEKLEEELEDELEDNN